MKGKIIPLSEARCMECGGAKSLCHNSFKNFPQNKCGVAFFEMVTEELFALEEHPFTLDQFHNKLTEKVYPHFKEINDEVALTAELLFKIHIEDLGVVEYHGIDRFQVV